MLDIKKLDLERFTKCDVEIIKELTEVVNSNETTKDQFEKYTDVMLEREEFGRAYEDDCVNGTLLVIFYHYDYLTAFKENHKKDLESGAIYIVESEK